MKKIFTFFAAVATTLSAMATTFSFSSIEPQTIDGITVTLDKGAGNNAPAVYSGHVRLYAKNTITVSGANLSNISLTFSKQGSKEYASLAASTGKLTSAGESTSNDDLKTDTWTGSSSSVTFTLGESGQRIIYQIVVNGDGSEEIPSNPSNPGDSGDTGSLDPTYTYAEPTIVSVPTTTVQGDAYSFISNNIEVSCTKGAITTDYFSAHAGFDITFTATKPIKGIHIDGFVKKAFEATADHGQISFLSPSEDTNANPVLVLTDVNSTSVTISCVKQLRCYSVEVYFEENPDSSVSGGNGGSTSSEALTFDSADFVYETEVVEYYGEENYSIFLYNEISPDFPYLALDIYPENTSDLSGTYSMNDYTLGLYTYYCWDEGDYDATWADDGQVTLTKNGNEYKIEGSVVCDNGTTYTFSFNGKCYFYTDEEYYYGDGDDEGGSDAVESVFSDNESAVIDPEAPMYNLQGRRVDNNYRGIVIQKGRKAIIR